MPRAPKKDTKNQEPLNYNYHTLLQEAKREYRAGQPARELKALQAQREADLAAKAARRAALAAESAQIQAELDAKWGELGQEGPPTLVNVLLRLLNTLTHLLGACAYVWGLCAISMCLVGLFAVRRFLLDYLEGRVGALGAPTPAPTGGGAARPALGRALDLLTGGLRALPGGAGDLLPAGLVPPRLLPPGVEPDAQTAYAPDPVALFWGPTWWMLPMFIFAVAIMLIIDYCARGLVAAWLGARARPALPPRGAELQGARRALLAIHIRAALVCLLGAMAVGILGALLATRPGPGLVIMLGVAALFEVSAAASRPHRPPRPPRD